MRLQNGFGSVYKLSGNRRKPWRAMKTIAMNAATGKQDRKLVGDYKTQQEALEALSSYNNSPYNLNAKNYTLSKIYELWSVSTYQNVNKEIPKSYAAAYNWLKDLHYVKFNSIKTAAIQASIDSCQKGYSTKKNIKILAGLLYKFAMENDIASKNYAEFTKLPEHFFSRKHVPFTDEEISKLWDNQENPRIQTILIMIYTGFRPTEMLKIRTENVHIREQYVMGGMKTAAGTNRIVPIANKILPFIQKRYNPNNEYLIMDEKGQLNYDHYRSRIWEPAMTKLKMVHLPHDCRHTTATLLDNAEINSNITKKILGHSGSNITEKVYIHKNFVQLLEAINMI